jgi:hypothetical protein
MLMAHLIGFMASLLFNIGDDAETPGAQAPKIFLGDASTYGARCSAANGALARRLSLPIDDWSSFSR